MTAAQLITALQTYPGTAPVVIQAFDWNPKIPIQVTTVVDAKGASTPTNPMIAIMAGPNAFNSYDNSGYHFPGT